MPSFAPNPDPWLIPPPSPYGTTATVVQVYRLTGTTTLTPLPSVRCVSIEKHAGTDPGVAAFRYDFSGLDSSSPQSAAQALSSEVNLPGTIGVNDRLVVKATRWDGVSSWLFDGLALDFRGELSGDTDQVDIMAVGISKRLWDTPIKGQLIRDSSNPTTGTDTPTDIIAQFNPRGLPNATEKNNESTLATDPTKKYSVFLDAEVCKDRKIGRKWTLPMVAQYLCLIHNPDETYVQNPTGDSLDNLLVAREPNAGSTFDPNDPATYTKADLIVSDRPMTGRDWPTVLHQLLRGYGFDLTTRTVDSGGVPLTYLRPFLRQGGTVKHLYLQPEGSDLDPSYSNMARGRLARDVSDVVNSWEVHGALERYEISVILSPGFPMTSNDSLPLNMQTYKKNSDFGKAHPDYYRTFVFDEAGDGHYPNGSATKITTATKFQDRNGCITGNSPYDLAIRRRPARPELISRVNGKAREPVLAYSTTYDGPDAPCISDGVDDDWQPISGWKLMKDRLGIQITANDPNSWQIGDGHVDGAPKKLNLVEILAAGGPLVFRLTCVVEGDSVLKGLAPRRMGSSPGHDPSPIPDTVVRVVDARDKYLSETVHESSEYFDEEDDSDARNDQDAAKADALQLRISTESGIMEGEITIDYLTDYYKIGDRIDTIAGRGLGLRTDGAGSSDTPVYPMVEGYKWEMDNDEQRTTLFLSDEATVRHSVERRVRRR